MKTIMRTHAMMRMRMRTWRQKHGGLRCLAELVKQPACQISSLYLAKDFCFSKYFPNMMQGFQIFFKYEEPPSPSQNDFDCQNIPKYDNARYPNISLSQMYSLYSWFPRKDPLFPWRLCLSLEKKYFPNQITMMPARRICGGLCKWEELTSCGDIITSLESSSSTRLWVIL